MLNWPDNRRKIAAGIVLLFVCAAYGYLTYGLPKRTLPDTPDPAFMPWIMTAVLCFLTLLLIWEGVSKQEDKPVTGSDTGSAMPSALFVGAFFVFILFLPYLGFVVAGMPFFAALMLLFGERRPLWLVAGSVGGPLILFAIFRYGFNIILPRGVIGGLIG